MAVREGLLFEHLLVVLLDPDVAVWKLNLLERDLGHVDVHVHRSLTK